MSTTGRHLPELPQRAKCRVLLSAIFFPLFLLSSPLTAASDYTLTPATFTVAGTHGTSANYTLDAASTSHGIYAERNAYSHFGGHTGRLQDVRQLHLSPTTAPEAAATQLSLVASMDDGFSSHPPTSHVQWSPLSGPVTGISASGSLTAGPVYQNTPASIRANWGGASQSLTLTLQNTVLDNFPPYSGDRLDDAWQVQNFGVSPAVSFTPAADPDGDGLTNLAEFAFGLSPLSGENRSTGYSGNVITGGGTLTQPGQPVVILQSVIGGSTPRAVFSRRAGWLAAGLRYDVEFSANLLTWAKSSATPVVLAENGGMQAVSIPYLPFVGGRKPSFFRVSVLLAP